MYISAEIDCKRLNNERIDDAEIAKLFPNGDHSLLAIANSLGRGF